MFRSLKWIAPLLALGLTGFLAAEAKAADEKGTVTGTVVDKDGKAVEGAIVRIMTPRQRGAGGAGGAGGAQKQADDPKPPAAGGDAGGNRGRGQRQPPVAEGKTDKDGKFSIQAPVGQYTVVAVVQGKGFARADVTVKANESASVELKLQDMPARGGGAGGGRGGNK